MTTCVPIGNCRGVVVVVDVVEGGVVEAVKMLVVAEPIEATADWPLDWPTNGNGSGATIAATGGIIAADVDVAAKNDEIEG